ncbi:hypothetical protein NDU88_004628 [Pleurodeles waltl]|uniref:Uncharacterized protein n=1 Tax=Pleurodeles waltl TaxID=8319 RepID=A0AAV7MU05_PLEWA|nr:hypothetical protein NDU88_004628 [Pleurodeles waltl]
MAAYYKNPEIKDSSPCCGGLKPLHLSGTQTGRRRRRATDRGSCLWCLTSARITRRLGHHFTQRYCVGRRRKGATSGRSRRREPRS